MNKYILLFLCVFLHNSNTNTNSTATKQSLVALLYNSDYDSPPTIKEIQKLIIEGANINESMPSIVWTPLELARQKKYVAKTKKTKHQWQLIINFLKQHGAKKHTKKEEEKFDKKLQDTFLPSVTAPYTTITLE